MFMLTDVMVRCYCELYKICYQKVRFNYQNHTKAVKTMYVEQFVFTIHLIFEILDVEDRHCIEIWVLFPLGEND